MKSPSEVTSQDSAAGVNAPAKNGGTIRRLRRAVDDETDLSSGCSLAARDVLAVTASDSSRPRKKRRRVVIDSDSEGIECKHANLNDTEVDGVSSEHGDYALALRLQEEEKQLDAKVQFGVDTDCQEAKEVREDNDERTMRCSICFESWALESIYFVPCAGNHTFCFDCTYQHVRAEVFDHGRRPRCPLGGQRRGVGGLQDGAVADCEGCSFVFQQFHVEEILRQATDTNERQTEARRIVDVLGALELPAAVAKYGYVRCPSCAGWFECLDMPGQSESPRLLDANEASGNSINSAITPSEAVLVRKAQCPYCSCSFCSHCEREPFHYRGACSDQTELQKRFEWWRREGRDAYVREVEMNGQATYYELLLLHDQHHFLRQQVEEVARRSEELRRDEKWKAMHCRLCPNCERPIQRIEGCNDMTCGSDGHGGNTQRGCGHKFPWNKAKKYVQSEIPAQQNPAIQELQASMRKTRLMAKNRASKRQRLPAWLDDAGEVVTCDICQVPIRGPRFDCIHCPSFKCCVNCEGMASTGVYRNHHPYDNHTFEIRFGSPSAEQHAVSNAPQSHSLPVSAETVQAKLDG